MRKYLLLNGYARRNSHRIGYPTINKYRSDCVAAVDKKRSISTRLSPSLNHDNAVGGQLGRYAMWMSSLTLALMAPAVETMCENTASTFYEMNQKNKDVKEEEAYAEEYNEEDERSCPFCRFFLDSPCKETFIKWQQCVKKSDKATDCMDSFHPLKICMDEYGITFDTSDDEEND